MNTNYFAIFTLCNNPTKIRCTYKRLRYIFCEEQMVHN